MKIKITDHKINIKNIKLGLINSIEILKKDKETYLEKIKNNELQGEQLRRTTWEIYLYTIMITERIKFLELLGDKKTYQLEKEQITDDYIEAHQSFENKIILPFYELKKVENNNKN